MTSRRQVVLALGAGALAVPIWSSAQQPRKIQLIGVLHPGAPPPAPASPALAGLQRGLRDSGYVEGKNIAFEVRYAGGKPETLPGLALELVRLKVDVLVPIGSPSIGAVQPVAGAIPIVAADLETDPVASGLVASYAKPGGNITGLFLDFDGLMGKWLELLTEAVPGIRRATVMWDASTPRFQLDALAAAAKTRSMELEIVSFKQATEIDAVLAASLKKRPQALIQLSSPIVNFESARIAKFTQANRLPAISMFIAFPEAGGLMSYGPSLPIFFRRLGPLVDKVLKGAKAGDIPLERPIVLEMVVNLKTAKEIGLKIPQTVLLRADRVIE